MIDQLIEILQECMRRIPGCTVGRSVDGTGNLCIYDHFGEYVGVIDLDRRPDFIAAADRTLPHTDF